MSENEDCGVALGLPTLRVCEAKLAERLLRHLLSGEDTWRQQAEWTLQSILKVTVFRTYMGQRPPYVRMLSADRSQRLSEVIEILIIEGIFVPLSVRETIEEIGEQARNKGSFVRVINIHRLLYMAEIEMPEPVPSNGMQPIVREAPRAYDVFMAERLLAATGVDATAAAHKRVVTWRKIPGYDFEAGYDATGQLVSGTVRPIELHSAAAE